MNGKRVETSQNPEASRKNSNKETTEKCVTPDRKTC